MLGFTGIIYSDTEYLKLDLASEVFVDTAYQGILTATDSATVALSDDITIIHTHKLQVFKLQHVVS